MAREIERDAEKRCKGRGHEREGRTHLCRLTAGHSGKHFCICGRGWDQKPVNGR